MAESTIKIAPPGNMPEFSVTDLATALKLTVEDRFGLVRVRGEISNYRGPHSSGHVYFSLKDQGARLDAVIWKGAFLKLKTRPEEGLEVIATGKITTFPGKSSYQIVIDALEPAGVGALMALLDARRKMFAAEGLFDPARKQLLPFLPVTIGVVTSPTGAVIRDILHRLKDRFPRRVIVWPVRVQGETAAVEIAAAITGFNALPEGGAIPRPDVLIVARGGGSLEDLWAFNEEVVVRAASESMIPLISAIGHETDTTLIDFVSDLRAPTPTGAAEKTVPVRVDLLAQTAEAARRLAHAQARLLERLRTKFQGFVRALPKGDRVLAAPSQMFDNLVSMLEVQGREIPSARKARLQAAAIKLARHAPQARLARARARLDAQAEKLMRFSDLALTKRAHHLQEKARRLAISFTTRINFALKDIHNQRQRLGAVSLRLAPAQKTLLKRRFAEVVANEKLLASLGYRNVLARGFALVRNSAGAPVRNASGLAAGVKVALEFCDGQIGAVIADEAEDISTPMQATGKTIGELHGEKPQKKAVSKKQPPKIEQGSLF